MCYYTLKGFYYDGESFQNVLREGCGKKLQGAKPAGMRAMKFAKHLNSVYLYCLFCCECGEMVLRKQELGKNG